MGHHFTMMRFSGAALVFILSVVAASGQHQGPQIISTVLDYGASQLKISGSGFGPALAYMRAHFHHEVTNQDLAAVSHMSVRAFERQFHATFHLTPQKFLRKLRLRIASRALVSADDSLSEIALNSGFADQSHFSREFRRQFGRTPREYREHYKLSAGVPVTKSAARKQ